MDAWKAGFVWEPVEALRFRVTQSRDIRAPAINELYSPGASVTNNITMININDLGVANPRGSNYVIPQRTAGGDIDVEAEEGDTTTIGFVFAPLRAARRSSTSRSTTTTSSSTRRSPT